MSHLDDCRRSFVAPIGRLTVIVSDLDDVAIRWHHRGATTCGRDSDPRSRLAARLCQLLARYFAGEDVDFSEIPTPRGTPFRRACWNACRQIPRGETRSYAALAAMAGSPGAARAAGQAMRHNPLPLVVPCHRVIAADGRLHGFSGRTDPGCNDLARKQFLLGLEGAAAAERAGRAVSAVPVAASA